MFKHEMTRAVCNRYLILPFSHNEFVCLVFFFFFSYGRDGRLTLFPVVLIQKHLPEQLLEEQPNKQVQEVAVEVAVKQLLFQKKLKNSLQPKASW